MKTFTLFIAILFIVQCAFGQDYKGAFRSEICNCLETESLKRDLSENTYKACFKQVLPQFAAQIDAQIVEEDLSKKYVLGQLARKDLLLAFKYELVYSCDIYFNALEKEILRKKLLAREKVTETDLEAQNQHVAMSPNAYAYFRRAQLHFKLGDLKASEADVKKSIAVNPYSDGKNAIRNEQLLLALIYDEQERYDEAIKLYDQASLGDIDTQINLLRAMADRKRGGNMENMLLSDNKTNQSESLKRINRRESKTIATSTNRSERAKANTKTTKKNDASALRKLFKIDN